VKERCEKISGEEISQPARDQNGWVRARGKGGGRGASSENGGTLPLNMNEGLVPGTKRGDVS
jgi:hypothetical protein